jgi:hypothetical protein
MFPVYTHNMVVFLANINMQHPKLQRWYDIQIKIVKLTCAITIVLNNGSQLAPKIYSFPPIQTPTAPTVLLTSR